MAIPVNFAFLVPHAMMKGLTKLGFCESTAGIVSQDYRKETWAMEALWYSWRARTFWSCLLRDTAELFELFERLFSSLRTNISILFVYRHHFLGGERRVSKRTCLKSLCFLLLSWMRFANSLPSSCVVMLDKPAGKFARTCACNPVSYPCSSEHQISLTFPMRLWNSHAIVVAVQFGVGSWREAAL